MATREVRGEGGAQARVLGERSSSEMQMWLLKCLHLQEASCRFPSNRSAFQMRSGLHFASDIEEMYIFAVFDSDLSRQLAALEIPRLCFCCMHWNVDVFIQV